MWYLVGNMFGGKWAGDKNIGVDALPMFLKPNFSYDKKTGAGEIEYTNYFLTDEFDEKAESAVAGFKISAFKLRLELQYGRRWKVEGQYRLSWFN